ncbi:MAG TPA: hypothetical protein VIV58_33430, partial [Kofleriaceae bacterium]
DEDPPTTLPVTLVDGNTPPHQHFSASEETRLFQSRDRRTPQPQPVSRDPYSQSQSQSSPSAARAPIRPPSAPPTASSRNKPASAPPPGAPPLPGMIPPTLPSAPAPGAPVAAPRPPVVAQPFGQPNPGFSNWGPPIAPQRPPRDATPTAQDSFDRPVYPQPRPSAPHVAGFGQKRPAKYGLKPWMLVAGAILVAILAFVITRAFIS